MLGPGRRSQARGRLGARDAAERVLGPWEDGRGIKLGGMKPAQFALGGGVGRRGPSSFRSAIGSKGHVPVPFDSEQLRPGASQPPRSQSRTALLAPSGTKLRRVA